MEILKEEVKVGLVLEVVQETQVPRDLKDILVWMVLMVLSEEMDLQVSQVLMEFQETEDSQGFPILEIGEI